jgi:hypothetical protein
MPSMSDICGDRDDKNMILEIANGLGGGQYVRNGNKFLTSYAKALKVPRKEFVAHLRSAPGELASYWLGYMTDSGKKRANRALTSAAKSD